MLATTAAASLLGAAVIAPATLSGSSAQAVAPMPSEEIFQQFVASAVPDTSIPTETIEVERLPDPEPPPAPKKAEQPAEPTEAAPAAQPMYAGGGAPAEWMAAAGIAESDWGYVDFIARAESGWNPNATNPSSGACGVIQALPCSKVPGNGYDPVDNLRWANGYATARYGSWAGAYAFWTGNHWW